MQLQIRLPLRLKATRITLQNRFFRRIFVYQHMFPEINRIRGFVIAPFALKILQHRHVLMNDHMFEIILLPSRLEFAMSTLIYLVVFVFEVMFLEGLFVCRFEPALRAFQVHYPARVSFVEILILLRRSLMHGQMTFVVLLDLRFILTVLTTIIRHRSVVYFRHVNGQHRFALRTESTLLALEHPLLLAPAVRHHVLPEIGARFRFLRTFGTLEDRDVVVVLMRQEMSCERAFKFRYVRAIRARVGISFVEVFVNEHVSFEVHARFRFRKALLTLEGFFFSRLVSGH